MKPHFSKLIPLFFFACLPCLGLTQEIDIPLRWAVIVDGNFGLQNSGNFDFRKNASDGQRLLGGVGRDGNFGDGVLGTGECGLETSLLTKCGIMIRGDVHSSRSLYDGVSRTEDLQVEGRWNGRGGSIGIGYGSISQNEKLHFFCGSMSIGSFVSQWEFYNNDADTFIEFGQVPIAYETTERFSSKNLYLDLNLKAGTLIPFNKTAPKLGVTASFSAGYRQSISKGVWVWEQTGETAQDINSTLMMGWYFKFCIGMGYIRQ